MCRNRKGDRKMCNAQYSFLSLWHLIGKNSIRSHNAEAEEPHMKLYGGFISDIHFLYPVVRINSASSRPVHCSTQRDLLLFIILTEMLSRLSYQAVKPYCIANKYRKMYLAKYERIVSFEVSFLRRCTVCIN